MGGQGPRRRGPRRVRVAVLLLLRLLARRLLQRLLAVLLLLLPPPLPRWRLRRPVGGCHWLSTVPAQPSAAVPAAAPHGAQPLVGPLGAAGHPRGVPPVWKKRAARGVGSAVPGVGLPAHSVSHAGGCHSEHAPPATKSHALAKGNRLALAARLPRSSGGLWALTWPGGSRAPSSGCIPCAAAAPSAELSIAVGAGGAQPACTSGAWACARAHGRS